MLAIQKRFRRGRCGRLAPVEISERGVADAADAEGVVHPNVDGPVGRDIDDLGLGATQDDRHPALVRGLVQPPPGDDAEARAERTTHRLSDRRLLIANGGCVAPGLALESERPVETEPPVGRHVPRFTQTRDDRGDRRTLRLRVSARLRRATRDEVLLRPSAERDHLERVADVEVHGPLGRPDAERDIGVGGRPPRHAVAESLRRGGRPVDRGDGRREPPEVLGGRNGGPKNAEHQERGLLHERLSSGARAPVETTSVAFSHFCSVLSSFNHQKTPTGVGAATSLLLRSRLLGAPNPTQIGRHGKTVLRLGPRRSGTWRLTRQPTIQTMVPAHDNNHSKSALVLKNIQLESGRKIASVFLTFPVDVFDLLETRSPRIEVFELHESRHRNNNPLHIPRVALFLQRALDRGNDSLDDRRCTSRLGLENFLISPRPFLSDFLTPLPPNPFDPLSELFAFVLCHIRHRASSRRSFDTVFGSNLKTENRKKKKRSSLKHHQRTLVVFYFF